MKTKNSAKRSLCISPSILSADFTRLEADIKSIESAAHYLHLDVMDGCFVPNLTFGPSILKNLKTSLKLDWHLMTENPEKYFADINKVGAEFVTVHLETCTHLHRTVEEIKNLGFKAGVALNPATPVCNLVDILPELDLVLIMSVNPGFGGQKFIPRALDKIKKIRSLNSDVLIEVDGGINGANAGKCFECGADILVSGSYIFNSKDRAKAIKSLLP